MYCLTVLLSYCLTVTRRIDSIVSTLPNYEESIGQSQSGIGLVTGKIAGKQGKWSLGLFASKFPSLHFTPYTSHPTLRANWADGLSVGTVVVYEHVQTIRGG